MVAECRKVFSVPGTAGSASSSHISRSVLASGCVQVDAGGSGCVRRFVDAGVPGVFDVPAASWRQAPSLGWHAFPRVPLEPTNALS